MIFTTTDPQANQTLSARIRRVYAAGFESAVFWNKKFMALFPVVPSQGDTAYRRPFKTAGNASARRKPAEGAAPPASSQATLINTDLAYETFEGRVEFTRETIAALQSNDARFYNVVEDEMQDVQDSIRHQIAQECLGAVRGGILNAVNNAGTYKGVNRAVQAMWQSLVTPLGGLALSAARLDAHWLAARDAVRAISVNAHLASFTQIRNYHQLTTGGAGAFSPGRMIVQQGAAPTIDIGSNWDGATYNNAPIVAVEQLAATVWLMLDATKFKYVNHDPFNVRELGPVDAGQDFYVWTSGVLTCDDPYHQSIITGLT